MGQKGSLSYIWAPVGSRPPMVRDNRHDNATIFGAICPGRGVGAAVMTPTANTECMSLHLAEVSTQVAPGSSAAVICDGAEHQAPAVEGDTTTIEGGRDLLAAHGWRRERQRSIFDHGGYGTVRFGRNLSRHPNLCVKSDDCATRASESLACDE